MAGEMFGAPAGQVAGIGSNYEIAATQKLFGDIAMQPLDAQLKQEQARYAGSAAGMAEARAGLYRQQLATQQQIQRRITAMGTPSNPGPTSPAAEGNRLSQTGNMFLDLAQAAATDPTTASKYLVAGANAIRSAETARGAHARAVDQEYKTNMATWNHVLGVLDNDLPVDQKIGLLQQIIPQDTEQRDQFFAQLPQLLASPEGVKALRQGVMTERERISADNQTRNIDSLIQARQLREKLTNVTLALRNAQVAKTRLQIDVGRKALGKPLKPLSKEERSEAQELLKQRYPELKGNDLDIMTTAVAQDAQALREKGMPSAAALQQALTGRQGDLEVFKSGGVFGVGGKTEMRANTGGHTAAEAIPVQQGTKFTKDRYYLVAGQRRRYKGGDVGKETSWGPAESMLSADEQAILDAPDDSSDDGEEE